jgi:hypothetical protein
MPREPLDPLYGVSPEQMKKLLGTKMPTMGTSDVIASQLPNPSSGKPTGNTGANNYGGLAGAGPAGLGNAATVSAGGSAPVVSSINTGTGNYGGLAGAGQAGGGGAPVDTQEQIAATAKAAADKAVADGKTAAEIKAAQDRATAAEKELARVRAEQSQSSSTSDILLQQMIAQQTRDAAAAALTKQQTRQSAIDVVTARFKQYGLETLATKIRDLAVDGATEATITLALQDTEEYKVRFKANTARLKAGLQVLQPADYLNLEDGYRQVLRSYGLTQFSTDEYVQQFISNDVSAKELSDRVSIATQRVQNADPAVLRQLQSYYGIGPKDAIAYILDPNQQITKIQRQVAAAEVGVAAAKQGLQSDVKVSEQLAAQGIDQAMAQKGYATIADYLPTAEKLSQIYGEVGKYDQSTAEQDVFNQLASAQRTRKKLTETEIAAFSGASGAAKAANAKQSTAGQF